MKNRGGFEQRLSSGWLEKAAPAEEVLAGSGLQLSRDGFDGIAIAFHARFADNTEGIYAASNGPVGVGSSGPISLGPLRASPNPFRDSVSISAVLGGSSSANATVEVFDVSGRRALSRAVPIAGGRVAFEWSGRDGVGNRLPAGTYFVRVGDGAAPTTTSIVLVR